MCELMGFTAKQPTNIKQYLNTFYSHSIRHPHGWGLMREQPEREIIKEAVRAVDSHILPDIIEGTHLQTTTLAHIRFATVGSIRQAFRKAKGSGGTSPVQEEIRIVFPAGKLPSLHKP